MVDNVIVAECIGDDGRYYIFYEKEMLASHTPSENFSKKIIIFEAQSQTSVIFPK